MADQRPPFFTVFWLLGFSALLAACTSPGTRVVLLPQDDGQPSAVAVHAKGGERVLSQPYQRAIALTHSTGAPRLDKVDPAKLRADNASLFDMRPPKPGRYIVHFEIGGTALTLESQQAMDAALADALARSGGDIVITGHTDTVGPGPGNDALSRLRAQEVQQMFIGRGFPALRIEAAGRGERELLIPTPDETEEPRNRRVVIEVR
ncbi:OmpA family protein [Polaromonas sp. SM01]|uniref:OmpA family protein n=1 Tax=Polaromonas sp. SM01 TaxID=3085630 RepID=UPI0029827878|nr:OmpA family protein [Polaromonas sp. SM01]MDW5445092.1 OmpA family protein [Polaromonas sp. SM01]